MIAPPLPDAIQASSSSLILHSIHKIITRENTINYDYTRMIVIINKISQLREHCTTLSTLFEQGAHFTLRIATIEKSENYHL